MEFVWNDGGRSGSGFVGLTGDCVTRSIAVATGTSYRDIYRDLGEASNKTPRNGVHTTVATEYLKKLGWRFTPGRGRGFSSAWLPKGVVIAHLGLKHGRFGGHFCTLIDHVIHDTWNPSEDDGYLVEGYWTLPDGTRDTKLPTIAPNRRVDAEQELTQKEFDKVLHRLRALDNTANNDASTEGEKRNALRMMQAMMLRHNLSREDITDDDNVESVSFTRRACPVNSSRACGWEKELAAYLIEEIFPLMDWYYGRRGHRTLFWFYGPTDDVQNCIRLFRELVLTIATAARLQYGGYSRGSGASYAEGYVRGLPRYHSSSQTDESMVSETALIHTRALAVRRAAREWLKRECGVSVVMTRGSARDQHDPTAAGQGEKHGAKHDVTAANGRSRITQRS
ncbi:DUF2786 domain-containing protein [Novipirellula artificiosorum]|uniref:Uncharacterized protein n=1 Tax=Novipirellula artificiosorum TaxID=2528016 RepID=A0A5C6E3W4_9BACT|nr:DUF2786 domain-containing protein [Novipirellula artificiosorum]TWU42281.1 hypothetical protein Poly41_05770 [Novipirellula artificiosorum]